MLRNRTLIDRLNAVVARWRVDLLRDGHGMRRPRPALLLSAALLLLALGAVDYVTGPELGSSVFYLLPVSLVAAYAHWRVAALFAVAAAGVWLVADLSSHAAYSHILIPYWNALIRLGFFFIVAFLLGALRNSYEASELRGRSLEAVNEVGRAILEERDADAVLELIATRARELARADFASIVVPDPQGELVVRVAVGVEAEAQLKARFPAAGSITGEVINSRRPISVRDAALDSHVQQPLVRTGRLGPALFIPLATGDNVFGTLAVANVRGGPVFKDHDVTILGAFGTKAAIALEYSDIRQELQRLAVFEDRERIAQELHDGVIQSLFGVGMTIQAAVAAEDQRVLRPELEHVLDEIDRVIRDVRSYIFALKPRLLTHHEFERAFRDLVEGFGQMDRVSLEVAIEPETASRLGPRSGDFLQAAREALSNAVRHSGGDRVTVNVRQTASALVLEIEDNGKGFDPHEEAGKGQGLSNLYARAQALGGRLDIETAPREGSRVRLLVPL